MLNVSWRKAASSLALAITLSACARAEEMPPPDWRTVDDFVVQLQRGNRERLGATAYDLLLVDMALAGNSPEALDALRNSPGGPKLVVSYMSIGQAADYQYYWQREWDTNPPGWVEEDDPEWSGDHWVRYWDPEWQAIIYGSDDSYLDRIIALGFDGVLLDRVDTATYFEEQGRETAYREMADFVMALAEYARARRPGFGIFTINGEDIGLRYPEYMDAVTGIMVEDLYYGYPRDHEPSPADWTVERETMLDQWVAAGKLIMVVDYTRVDEQIADGCARAAARGYMYYAADRSLGNLRINEGCEPD